MRPTWPLATLLLLGGCAGHGRSLPRAAITLAAADPRVGTYVSKPWGFSTCSYWIEAPEGLILIDTQFLPSAAREAVEWAEAATQKKVVAAFVLHPNPDKFNGAVELISRGIPVYTSAQVRALIPGVHEDRKRSFYARYQPDYPAEAPILESFGEKDRDFSVAGTTVHLHVLGPGASEAHVALEWEGHLFAGDLVTNDGHAWLEIGKTDAWLERLQELAKLEPRIVHPGRGPSGDAGLLAAQSAYLRRVMELVAAENPTEEDDAAGQARAIQKIEAAYPGYGFEVFLKIGVPAEWARQARAKKAALAAADPMIQRIDHGARAAPTAYQRLSSLTDDVGPRLSGSPALERAVAWALAAFKSDGAESVHAEPVMVPHWVRGEESAAIVSPIEARVEMLALGGSSATPKGGLVAELISVRDFEELNRRKEEAKGRIVLFDHPMPAYSLAEGTKYGETVQYRAHGPAAAERLGAVAALVRSVTARSLGAPHTGGTRFDPGQKKIPAAAVSVEDAALLSRLAARGPVRMRLSLSATTLPDAPSANVVAELVGRERPEEVVLLCAHLDSWDVGQGAHDDGAGVAIVMDALRVLRALELRPRRTIRAVLFTNEENGLQGALHYAEAHREELPRVVAAIEADTGGFRPRGFEVDAAPEAFRQIQQLGGALSALGSLEIRAEDKPGADLSAVAQSGAPLLGLWMDESSYFDVHHSRADTLDKVDPEALQADVGVVAAMAYLLAERAGDLPRKSRPRP